ncbi:hypothetical protein RHMOL_Rhmol10G0144500 [Rhododendron molle]|uniref:Uncharacterized protein n=1 Tax=Rhododendron molle TaxID=49168 RepID=A0ACC0M368_RHOML|nr:hypothetical protein RHMOL_Rhmol10G0144500 [Rhododendron molle]
MPQGYDCPPNFQVQKMIMNMIRNTAREKLKAPKKSDQGDLLNQAVREMNNEKFLTEDFIVYLISDPEVLFASSESVSSAITLAIKLLCEHPSVVNELRAEHEAILNKRENLDSTLTWDEYKSMPFSLQVC